jgi:hypothetical protein
MTSHLRLVLALFLAVGIAQGQEKKPAPGKPKKPAPARAKEKEKDSDWKKFTSREGAFSVLMPGTPVAKREAVPTPIGQVVTHFFSLEVQQGTNLTVSFAEVPQGLLGLEGVDDLLLTMARDAAVKQVDGKLLKDEPVKLNQRIPGREFQIDVGLGSILRMRVFLVQNRVYQIVAAGPKDYATGKDADKFLDSFMLGR